MAKLGETIMIYAIGVIMTLVGYALTRFGISKGRRVGYLRKHGIPLPARVVQVDATAIKIGHIPIYRLTVEYVAPQGGYRSQVSKTLHAHEASAIVGRILSILVHPENPGDVILDEDSVV